MKSVYSRTLIGLSVLSAMMLPLSLAHATSLTGYGSDHTIPDTLFDETETAKPWVKAPPAVKKSLRPATTDNVRQSQRLQQLQKSLTEQQRLNSEAEVGYQSEKLALENQLKTLQANQNRYAEQQQQLDQLQRQLTLSNEEHSRSQLSLAEMRTQLTANQILVDSHALQKRSLSETLHHSEQRIAGLLEQLSALNKEKALLQNQQADTDKQHELTQHQEKIAQLQTTLAAAEQQQSTLQSQLDRLQRTQQTQKPESHDQKLAYANGVAFADNIVQSLRAQQNLGLDPDRSMVLAGIKDAFDRRIALNQEEVAKLVTELDSNLNNKLQVKQQQDADVRAQQLKAGQTLIAATKKRKGVKQLDDALYIVTKAGKGKKLAADSTVDILITGRLADGTLFDNSGKENKVQRVKLDSLLPALTAVISQVNAGSELEVILPPEKAFGDNGVENLIPGGATLIFNLIIK